MCEGSASSCESACALTLEFSGGKTLTAPRCTLSEASPVLRNVLSLALAIPGVLALHDDDPEAWEDVLRAIVPKDFIPDLVNWDNVERMLVLADKYDMAYVRGICCQFLSFNAANMSLKHPLASAQNPLRGASLACLYGSKAESLGPYRQAVLGALEGVLAKLFDQPKVCLSCYKMAKPVRHCSCSGPSVFTPSTVLLYKADSPQCNRLLELVKDALYPQLVVNEVQTAVLCALLRRF